MHICVPPGVAVSTPNKELFWHPNLLFLLLPHLLPVENPQIATQHFKNAPTPSEKTISRSGSGLPGKEEKRRRTYHGYKHKPKCRGSAFGPAVQLMLILQLQSEADSARAQAAEP